jgi:hypothetical protein|tara:strand:+ start:1084 stop:1281 length:198 start_codon:yes stop_codon:yes gene_type:complete
MDELALLKNAINKVQVINWPFTENPPEGSEPYEVGRNKGYMEAITHVEEKICELMKKRFKDNESL